MIKKQHFQVHQFLQNADLKIQYKRNLAIVSITHKHTCNKLNLFHKKRPCLER